MKNIKGFIDPVSLSLILVLGIGTMGVMSGTEAVDEGQTAQATQDQAEQLAPVTEESRTTAYN